MPNRLAAEPSPYLLQHANNPVDWYPWGADAFDRARREDKPIFLSIGYSTCHWCHVMERESFESDEIASALNDGFVSIKVDREERPDVDRVYMTFVQATTGAGGWPMSVWLTPDLKPFFGGTYFPPDARWGRPGFIDILREVAQAWNAERDRVAQSADSAVERLQSVAAGAAGRAGADAVPGPDALAEGVEQFQRTFDVRWGGFGDAPKFPRPSELFFLLREHARTALSPSVNSGLPELVEGSPSKVEGSPSTNRVAGSAPKGAGARDMVLHTLRAMASGGMRDHLGGGFHRYSVDAEWRVPHFEKMLYDQAQLVLAYLEAFQVTGGDEYFAAIAEDTLAYVQREMTAPDGGFYSAEDADSLPATPPPTPDTEKKEGAFYVWTAGEIASLLGPDADVVRFRYGIEDEGNAPHDPHGEFTRQNLLYVARSVEDVARLTARTEADVEQALARARRTLLDERGTRPRPHLDDKVLAAWNGLMIAAFARAARVLADGDRGARWGAAARAAASFVRSTMWDATRRRLYRRFRDGRGAIDGYCEDYAFVVWGLLELFQADSDPTWLEWAMELQARQDELFWDAAGGGWFSTTGEDESVLLRLKEDHDGAEPAASSISVLNQLMWLQLTGDAGAARKIEATLRRYGPDMDQVARVVPMMMAALSGFHASRPQIVIVGHRDAEETRAMRDTLARHYLPFAVSVFVEPGPHQQAVARLLPFIEPMVMQQGRATAYVCRDFTCQAPAVTTDALREALQPGA